MHPSQDPARQPSGPAVIVDAEGLPALFDALRDRGYTVVGPTVRDGAIVVAELASVAELPFGWGVETEAGRYRLRERSDTAAFGHSAGPQSWKSVLHPARARLWSADRVSHVLNGMLAILTGPGMRDRALLDPPPPERKIATDRPRKKWPAGSSTGLFHVTIAVHPCPSRAIRSGW